MGPGIVLLKHLPLSFNNIEHMGLQHIVYNVEPLNFLGHVYVPGSKLTQHKVFLGEFRVREACCRLSWRKLSVNLEYQQQ